MPNGVKGSIQPFFFPLTTVYKRKRTAEPRMVGEFGEFLHLFNTNQKLFRKIQSVDSIYSAAYFVDSAMHVFKIIFFNEAIYRNRG